MKPNSLTREELSWILYDVGNSAFVLVMVTAVMPIFFKDYAASRLPDAIATANWGFANSAASLLLAFLAPVLGVMADYKGYKIRFFAVFMILGLCFTLLLTLIQEGQWRLCLLLFVVARMGWAGANIFYDALIVDVTAGFMKENRMDRVSAAGYAWGYIGSVIPFLIIVGLILTASGEAYPSIPVFQSKLGFVVVALWWFAFALPLLKNVKQKYAAASSPEPLKEAFSRLWRTFADIRKHRQAFFFLIAYFFYIDGVDTIISMSTAYGRDLGFSVTLLIGVILFIQIIAFPFALLYGWLAGRFSAKTMLMAGICVYCIITLMAFLLPEMHSINAKTAIFWFMAFLVGSSMGGIQALSRSFFGRLIPAENSAEFFGFYNVFGKFAAISGPFLMGVVGRLSGHSRWGVLSILLLFIIGAWLLSRVDGRAA